MTAENSADRRSGHRLCWALFLYAGPALCVLAM